MKVVLGDSTFSKEITDQVHSVVMDKMTVNSATAEALTMGENAIYNLLGEIVRYMPGFAPQVYKDLKEIVPTILQTEEIKSGDLLILFVLSNAFREALVGFEQLLTGRIIGHA